MTKEEEAIKVLDEIAEGYFKARRFQKLEAIHTAQSAIRFQMKRERQAPLTLDELVELGVRAENGENIYVYCTPLNDWAKVFKFGLLFFGTEDYQSWAQIDMDYGKRWLAYRHKPEVN